MLVNICNEFEVSARNKISCYFLTSETRFLSISMSFQQPCSLNQPHSVFFLRQTFWEHFAVIARQT